MKRLLVLIWALVCISANAQTIYGGAQSGANIYVLNPPSSSSAALTTIYGVASGAVVAIPWSGDSSSAMGGWETSSGSASAGYDFSNFDAKINAQLGFGAKKVVVLLRPISFGGHNTYTPDYVFTAGWATSLGATRLYTAAGNDYVGSGAIIPGHSAQGADNSAFPAAWMPAFKTAWINALQAALNHMKAASYASKIAYVRAGGGAGGEWTPFATDSATAGLLTVPGGPTTMAALEPVWLAYMAAVQSAMLATNSGFKLDQSLNGGYMSQSIPYTFADDEASLSDGNGFGLGDQGLQNADLSFFSSHDTDSGGSATHGYPGGDHAYLFDRYASNPLKEFQTIAASDPTYVGIPSAGTMGSLVPLLPYATARGATAVELYYDDWQVAYDPTSANYATYGADYRAAITAAAAVPAGTVYTTIGRPFTATCGPPNYCAYTGTGIALWPTVPDMGGPTKNGRVFYDTSLPSSNPSPVVRCTDATIDPNTTYANQSKSAGLGGSGDAEQLFNVDSTLVRFNLSGGSSRIAIFNPVTMVCGDPITGYAITADKNQTNPGSAANGYNFGPGSFSWTDASVFYALGGSDAPTVGVAKYSINTATGKFTVQTPYLDFTYGLPLGSLAPAWQANHAYATGDYISAALLALPDWAGGSAYTAGDLILPLSNNYWGCAFKLSVAGTIGTEPANWSKQTDGGCVTGQTIGEGGTGTEKWRNLGNSGTFSFQLTSAGGTSGSSTPNFATASGHPDLLSTVTDAGLTWTNTGPMIAPAWKSFAGLSKDSNRFCMALSSNSYGHGTGTYNNDNADQGTGIYLECYDFSLNQFVLLNTATGIQSSVTCRGGTGYSCAGGTPSKLTAMGAPYLAITGKCSFPLHNAKDGSTLDYVVVAKQGNLGGSCNGQNLLAWQPFATFNASTNLQIYNTVSNHWTIGKKLFVNLFDQSSVGYTSGAYTELLDSANPTAAPTISWQVGAPYTSACDVHGVWHAGDTHPPCDASDAYDSHTAFLHGPLDDDTGPVCGSIYNYATLAPPPVAPYQGEEVCITTTPNWSSAGRSEPTKSGGSHTRSAPAETRSGIRNSPSASCRKTESLWRFRRTGIARWAICRAEAVRCAGRRGLRALPIRRGR